MGAFRYHIGPEGPTTASVAIVAEKPGRDEAAAVDQGKQPRPLIGASGKLVDRHIAQAGYKRGDVWLTNAIQDFDTVGTPSVEDIIREQPRLFRELAALPNLKVIVAMGSAALASLTNFHYTDILNRRGSVLQASNGIKLVPTLHPAFYMRGEWRYKSVVDFDIRRAFKEANTNSLPYRKRVYYVEPDYLDAVDWLSSLIGAKEISFDIELWRRPLTLSCIALSDKPERAYCIPFAHNDRSLYWPIEQHIKIWKLLQKVLAQPGVRYITQNGLFDCWYLWKFGIETPYMGSGFDTMYAHRVLCPDLPHTLAFLTSIYTDEPYYKDESGDWRDPVKIPDQQFWIYNCKDALVTIEVAHELMADMAEGKLLGYYQDRVQKQWDSVVDMMRRGIKVDLEALKALSADLTSQRAFLEADLKTALGQDWLPNTKSPKDMERFFSILGLQPSLTPTGRPKADEESLIHYTTRAISEQAKAALFACIDISETRTLLSGFTHLAVDEAGFYHPHLDISKAVSGRAASKGSDSGGPQIQNIPKRVREIFIPDDAESVILNADYKQAEVMFVAWDARDELLIKAFESGVDVHRVRAAIVYRNWDSVELPSADVLASITTVCPDCVKLKLDSCHHAERYMAKQAGLAFGYKMGVRKFIRIQAKERLFISLQEAERIRDRIVSPPIKLWQEEVSMQLRNRSSLTNPFGRIRQFFTPPDEETLRAGLSWLAQSTIADLTNTAMIKLEDRLRGSRSRLLTNGHDALVLSVHRGELAIVANTVKSTMEQTITIHNRPLRIPVELSIGPNWGQLEELK